MAGFLEQIQKIVVLGCGGTGSILIPQLTRFLTSLDYKGPIVFVDGDAYEKDNASRQIFNLSHVGTNKAEYQAKAVSSQIPMLANQIEFVDKYVGKEDLEDLVEEGTVVFNCTDNAAARKFTEDIGFALANFAHICCGNDLVTGQTLLSMKLNGEVIARSIYTHAPTLNSDNDDRSKMSCQQLSELPGGGQLICANMTAACLALNMFMTITSPRPTFQSNTWVPNEGIFFDCSYNKFAEMGGLAIGQKRQTPKIDPIVPKPMTVPTITTTAFVNEVDSMPF